MSEKQLIDKSREIQERLEAEIMTAQGLNLSTESYDQRIRYVFYVKSGSSIGVKSMFTTHISNVEEVGLYVHLPFCRKRCKYCCYFSVVNQPKEIVSEYLNALKKELELLKKTSKFKNAVIRYIYFGGGTPTCLDAQQLSDLILYLRRELTILPNLNFTCEISPETTIGTKGKEKLKALLENGVNRLSLGVQSFDDEVLRLIGRGHNSATALTAYRNAIEAGFTNINIDLMFGLPGQTVQSWERDLQIAMDLQPGWLSLSRLRFDNQAINRMYAEKNDLFPDANVKFLMNIMAVEKVTEYGYQQALAPVSFRLPGKEKFPPRYWLGRQELALGAGASSYLNGVRYSNVMNLEQYIVRVDRGQLPISSAWKYSNREQVEKETIRMLCLSKGVNRRDFHANFGVDIEKMFAEPWNRLKKAGMITDDGKTFNLSNKGLIFAVEVCKQFYTENLMDKLKNKVYQNQFLRRLFLKYKYNRYVEGLSNLVKAAAGVLACRRN